MYSQLQELAGGEGQHYHQGGYTYGYETREPYWESDIDLSSIDPELRPLQPPDVYSRTFRDYSVAPRQYHSTYDPAAQGFCYPAFQPQHPESALYPNVQTHPWIIDLDRTRHMRYLSPTDPLGIALSSSESSISDYALSPDAGGCSDLPFRHVNADIDAPSFGLPLGAGHTWSPGSPLMPPLPSTLAPSHRRALSMRDFEVTPDPPGEDEPMDDRDVLPPRLPLPEELELSEQVAIPADSGLGQSIGDDEIKDEGAESGAGQGDDDSDFVPAARVRPRRRSIPVIRQSLRSFRRAPTGGAVSNLQARVHKASHSRPALHASKSRSKFKRLAPQNRGFGSKSFPCTFHHYGCRHTFASKNEWKRHVASQHLQLGYYRCDLGTCSPEIAGEHHRGYNDFNRKDLFTQHCRRMHAPWVVSGKSEDAVTKKERDGFEKQLEGIRTRCWVDRRRPPERSRCGFCGETFVDSNDCNAWEERMEHVGHHLDRDGSKMEEEDIDEGLKQWGLAEGVIQPGTKKGDFWLVGHELAPCSRVSSGRRRSGRLVGKTPVKQDDGQDGAAMSTESDGQHSGDVSMKHQDDGVDDAEGDDE